jgi:D-alanyl-D-alanine carboxypeptidase/D-alanyl-D-alanine-endopeptidase (penicillin-binding protein 4)
VWVVILIGLWLGNPWLPASSANEDLNKIKKLIGARDAVLVVDAIGKTILAKNEDKALIPASTLKILTSLVAIHHLGLGYRFATEFYVDEEGSLKIKGYGDPLLVSEVVADIARELARRLDKINHIVLDDSFFTQPLVIPGISSSSEPYDAPNGALGVNFNTVNFKKENGVYISAEPQTPLLPFALPRVKRAKLNAGRIVLSHNENECTLYAGHLFEYFLRQAGLKASGIVKLGQVRENKDRLVYRYQSGFTLEEIIGRLLEHSNNYTTNQILIAAGVDAYGPPGTLSKGVRVATAYARDILRLEKLRMTEGSGISRHNKISAKDLVQVLEGFEPYRYLMRHKGRTYYKTGTLHGISTRAGYIDSADGGHYRYAVLVNTRGRSTNPVVRKLLRFLP